MKNDLVILKDVTFGYRNHLIFEHLNLSIKKNKKISIMGINGSGKTTLLKILNGLLFLKKGKYIFLEQEITKQKLKNKEFHLWFRKNNALLFQNSDFMFFHPVVYDDLAFSLRMCSINENLIQEKIFYWSDLFRITNLLKKNPIYLSGGERKKIALAMILIQDPELILLDEPFNHLDPVYTGHLIEIFNSINKTILFTSHNFELSSEITEEFLILHPKHQVIFFGNINQFFSREDLIKKSELYHIHSHKHKNLFHRHKHIHNWRF
ncbi:MAG: energy-coupling factor ABC transporter ATP-binding protein [Leptonema sp. (in: bacteria)]